MTFGEKIRESRITMKLTQKQLAEMIGAKHNSISDWENDKNKPDPNTIELLCGVLNISPNYLLGTNSDEFSLYEKEMIKKYRDLDDHGREMVDFTLQKEWERATAVSDKVVKYRTNIADAAHERTDIDIPADADTSDNDIMDDELF